MVGRMAVTSEEPIRLLVVGLSTLVRELVESAADENVELVEMPSSVDLVGAIDQTHADFVLLPLERSQLPADARRYLAGQAHVRVLGVQEDNGSAVLYQLVPSKRELGDCAPRELVDAIRRAASGSDSEPV